MFQHFRSMLAISFVLITFSASLQAASADDTSRFVGTWYEPAHRTGNMVMFANGRLDTYDFKGNVSHGRWNAEDGTIIMTVKPGAVPVSASYKFVGRELVLSGPGGQIIMDKK